jgi:hypothetical protein
VATLAATRPSRDRVELPHRRGCRRLPAHHCRYIEGGINGAERAGLLDCGVVQQPNAAEMHRGDQTHARAAHQVAIG